jgi:hypothetical protein
VRPGHPAIAPTPYVYGLVGQGCLASSKHKVDDGCED